MKCHVTSTWSGSDQPACSRNTMPEDFLHDAVTGQVQEVLRLIHRNG